jgi:prephenate dehydrogenase
MLFERVAILGVGLIGGSFALALKEARALRPTWWARAATAPISSWPSSGASSIRVAADAVAAAHGADLVLLAAPLAQFPKLLREVASGLGPKALVTDGGSTKRDVVAAARAALGRKIGQFVPAHPIAGGEKSGAGAASATLFQSKRVVLTPLPKIPNAVSRRSMMHGRSCGATSRA